MILASFDHLPTPGWHLWRNSFAFIRESLHTVDIFSTKYLPRLVYVVCECPLVCYLNLWKKLDISNYPSFLKNIPPYVFAVNYIDYINLRRTSKVEEQFSSAFKNDHKSFGLDLLRLVAHLSKVCCQSEWNCCLVLVMIWSFQVCTQKTFYPIIWQHYADTLFSAPDISKLTGLFLLAWSKMHLILLFLLLVTMVFFFRNCSDVLWVKKF